MSTILKTSSDLGIQILTAFETGNHIVPANTVADTWQAIGGAFKAELTANCRLQTIAFVAEDCEGAIRVYDITANLVSLERAVGQVFITNTDYPGIKLGPNFTVTGGHVYQIQAKCSGPAVTSDNQLFIQNVVPQEV